MAAKTDNRNFNFESMDWKGYEAYRPRYPPLLYQRIYAHHADNGGSFDTALDVGGGAGIVTKELLQRFSHVTLSDMSELYVSQAKQIFSTLPNPSQLSFLTSKMELLTLSQLPHGPVDLITAAECLHWMDLPSCARVAATLLKPHGTFSAWMYAVRPGFPVQDTAYAAYERLYCAWLELYSRLIEPIDENFGPGRTTTARLDDLPLDPAAWSSVERVYAKRDTEDVYMCAKHLKPAETRVGDGEHTEWLSDDGFLSEEADYEWLENYFEHLIPPLEPIKNLKVELQELKEAMGGRTVSLEWPMGLVIATRR